MLVEAGEEEFAAAGHFLGGGGAEHLVDVAGALAGDGLDFGLGHGHKKEDVAAEELDGAVDDFGAHGRFGEVGDPEDEGTAGLEAVEGGGGAEVVGFTGFGVDEGEGLDDLAEVGGSAAGEDALLDGLAVGEEADSISGEEGELGEGYGGGAGVIEFGVGSVSLGG